MKQCNKRRFLFTFLITFKITHRIYTADLELTEFQEKNKFFSTCLKICCKPVFYLNSFLIFDNEYY